MDDVLSFVLDGLEDYLELARELGVRTIEADREAVREIIESSNNRIVESAACAGGGIGDAVLPMHPGRGASPTPPQGPAANTGRDASPTPPQDPAALLPVAFIHDRPLTPKAVEMMAKIVVALGQTPETAPVAVAPPLPRARFYVFLGRRARLKYIPGARAEENKWFKTPKGMDALYVKTPEDIVRYETVTPALQKIKREMWEALKTISARIANAP